jgi:serine/threonine protein kinase/Tol biopolymer transport system component
MDPERWQKVERIFNRVLDAGDGRRAGVLEESCAGDEGLRREVESLLAQHESAGDFIETPAFATASHKPRGLDAEAWLAPNSKIGHYRIVRRIGRGGMGVVYEAEDLRLGRRVALKFLPEEFAADTQWVQRFRTEARLASALNHANICTIYEADEVEGRLFIAMELLEGQTLQKMIATALKPLPVKTVLQMGVQIAVAAAAAHGKGIVHRDLKPGNIFVTTQGQVKILDFGIAKLTGLDADPEAIPLTTAHHTRTGMVVGAIHYMSPEQMMGKAVDHRSDIFELGLILYEMLTGKRPFQGPNFVITMAAMLNGEPLVLFEDAPNVPVGLQRVVIRCLETTPERRFQSAADLAFALESLGDATGIVTSPVGVSPTSSRKRFRLAGVAGVVVLAMALLYWWTRPPGVPVVEAITQITDDGIGKGVHNSLQTDGPRIYFNEGRWGSLETKQVAVTGGPIAAVPTSLVDAQPTGIAPDGTFLVVLPGGAGPPPKPVWKLPLPTGEPVRMPMLEAQDANVTSDGHLLLARMGSLYFAEKDGSNLHKLAFDIEGFVGDPAVSPDGRRIVFTRYPGIGAPELFIANTDGSDAHLLARSDEPGGFCCAQWVANGRYIVFETRVSVRQDLWYLSMERRWLKSAPEPMRLTAGPLSYFDPMPSRDGKQIYALGSRQRGELVRCDIKSKQFIPILQGVSATNLSYSQDGKWVSYLVFPDRTLWRSRSDGTDRLQLASGTVGNAVIAPDAQHVLFIQKGVLCLIGIDGGERRVLENDLSSGLAGWSPDGNQIVFWTGDGQGHQQAIFHDLASGKRFAVSGSISNLGSRWIGDDKMIAVNKDSAFMVLDIKTRQWSPLGLERKSNLITRWGVSPDYKFVYYTVGGPDPELMRFGIADHKSQTVASLKDVQLAGFVQVHGSETQVTVAPDGSPVMTRDTGTQEIYALSVKWP